MTIFAFPLFYFVQHKSVFTVCNGFMAFIAGNTLMFTIELECSPVMIKRVNLPLFGIMAPGTIRYPVHIKLIKMLVGVTADTCGGEFREFLDSMTGTVGREMTSLAFLCRMSTCQGKP